MTLSILLYMYIAFVAIFVVVAIIQIGHVFLLSVNSKIGYFATLVYLIALVTIVGLSYLVVSDVQWSTPLFSLFETNGSQNLMFQ